MRCTAPWVASTPVLPTRLRGVDHADGVVLHGVDLLGDLDRVEVQHRNTPCQASSGGRMDGDLRSVVLVAVDAAEVVGLGHRLGAFEPRAVELVEALGDEVHDVCLPVFLPAGYLPTPLM